MIELEKAFWTLTAAVLSIAAGQYAFSRNRTIKVEQRLSILESNQVTEQKVKSMIEEAQKPLFSVLEQIKKTMDEHKEATNSLSGLVGELNVKAAVLEEKMSK